MSFSTELAAAARRVRALVDRLDEDDQPDVSEDWNDLLEMVDGRGDDEARGLIAEWLDEMEQRLDPGYAEDVL